jgi:uncharacterized membrane protein YqhA
MNEASTGSAISAEKTLERSKAATSIAKAAGWTRYIVVVPILGLFVAAVTMTGVAAYDVIHWITLLAEGHVEMSKLVVGFIEVADIFLLAIVLYIMAIGLYELFIDDSLPLPAWLEVHSLEDLKEKLISVVVVVLAIFFLGRVVESQQPIELLYMGIGIAAIIGSLGYFASKVLLHKAE